MASTVRSTTQQQIDVEDVIDNLILQKDGSCSMVLQTNAVNFGLLSEEEQDATIYAYAAFLNSLTFNIQILIRSDLKDISGYIRLLEQQELKQNNPIKKKQINSYKKYIASLITDRNVLEKKFYIIIPFSTLELGVSQSFTAAFFKSNKSLPFEKSYIIEKARASLEPKREHILRQLGRIGVAARQLQTQELIQMLFSMYNASSTQGQKISKTTDYTIPLVQPAYIRPEEQSMTDQSNQPVTPPTNQAPIQAAPASIPPQQQPAPQAPSASPTTEAPITQVPQIQNQPVNQTPQQPQTQPQVQPSIPTLSEQSTTAPAQPSPNSVPQTVEQTPQQQVTQPQPQQNQTPATPPTPTMQPTQPPQPTTAPAQPSLNDAQSVINSAASDLTSNG